MTIWNCGNCWDKGMMVQFRTRKALDKHFKSKHPDRRESKGKRD